MAGLDRAVFGVGEIDELAAQLVGVEFEIDLAGLGIAIKREETVCLAETFDELGERLGRFFAAFFLCFVLVLVLGVRRAGCQQGSAQEQKCLLHRNPPRAESRREVIAFREEKASDYAAWLLHE